MSGMSETVAAGFFHEIKKRKYMHIEKKTFLVLKDTQPKDAYTQEPHKSTI